MLQNYQFAILHMSLNQKVRKLDIFKKVPQELSQASNRGGLLSLLTAIIMLYFTVIQIRNFLNPELEAAVIFQQPVTRKQMTVRLDIIFPNFPCQVLALDVQDDMLTHNPNIDSIGKYRLDSSQHYVDNDESYQLFQEPNEEKQYLNAKNAFQKGYGCHVRSQFKVKQVPGNFHISSHPYNKIYHRLIIQNAIKTIDVSHQINHLFFGDMSSIDALSKNHPQSVLNPLSKHTKRYSTNNYPSYVSHYHLNIVPTLYPGRIWFGTNAYQYTYNHNTFLTKKQMPSVYFNYQIGGIRVSVAPHNSSVSQFLIKLCAIIGGTYAIATFVGNALDSILDDRRKQYELIS